MSGYYAFGFALLVLSNRKETREKIYKAAEQTFFFPDDDNDYDSNDGFFFVVFWAIKAWRLRSRASVVQWIYIYVCICVCRRRRTLLLLPSAPS